MRQENTRINRSRMNHRVRTKRSYNRGDTLAARIRETYRNIWILLIFKRIVLRPWKSIENRGTSSNRIEKYR